jgi:hypothetical protein
MHIFHVPVHAELDADFDLISDFDNVAFAYRCKNRPFVGVGFNE